MNDHTPGPWATNPAKAQVDAFNTGNPLPVCQLLWPTRERDEDETRANANLIAAAPDMYEAILTAACPAGGWNGMPKELEGCCTVADCVKSGTCGCDLGAAINKAHG